MTDSTVWIVGLKPGTVSTVVQALDQMQTYHTNPRPYYMMTDYSDTYDVLLPFRSHPPHHYIFHLYAPSSPENGGIDLTKPIIIPKAGSTSFSFPLSIPSDQYSVLKRNKENVKKYFSAVIKQYSILRAKENLDLALSSSEKGLINCSTLLNYEDQLQISEMISLAESFLLDAQSRVRAVAIESTDDNTDDHFRPLDAIRKPDGEYFRPPQFRIVEVRANAIRPINTKVFRSAEAAKASISDKQKFVLVPYSSLIAALEPPEENSKRSFFKGLHF